MDAILPSAEPVPHLESASGGDAATGAAPWRGKLLTFLAAVVVFLPAVCSLMLVKSHVVNAPHYDDFTFLVDWLNYKTGHLTWSDLFSVHLEHRVTVPRLLALGAHLMGGSDLRWQNGLTQLLLLGTWFNLLVIWRRTTGTTIRLAWLPLLAMSMVLFCAVQWQPLLWPILFEIFAGTYAFTLALRLWSGRMHPWLALVLSVLLCVAAMFSFGNGPLTSLLIPFAIWFQRNDLDRNLRRKLVGTWLGCLVLMMLCYFHDFHNSEPPQFSYNLSDSMTAEDTIGSSLKSFMTAAGAEKAVLFFFTVLGSHLCRGLHLNSLVAAQWIGGISLAFFCGILVFLFIRRRDGSLLRSATPWVLIGLYSIGTAALITIGRVWLTRSGIIALLPRYNSHAVALSVSLVALSWIAGHRLLEKHRWLATAGTLAAGAFLFLNAVEWIYGARMMDGWRNARLTNKAMLMFTNVMPDKNFLGPISGDGGYGAKVMHDLDAIHQSPVPLLKDLRLANFHRSRLDLRHRQAGFNELHDTENDTKEGGLLATGYSELPDQRPADLVLFSTPDESGVEQIFGFTWPLRLPNFLHSTTYKDHDGQYMEEIDSDQYSRWEGHLTLAKKPARNAPIKAWALDADRMLVHLIPDNRQTKDYLTPLPTPPQDPKD